MCFFNTNLINIYIYFKYWVIFMNNSKSFASDNSSGVNPKIMQKLLSINTGHSIAYGNDCYTENAVEKFKEIFGRNIEVFFVFNGTGANVLGLKAITDSYNSIICPESSHINFDECCAPEKFTGCKLITIKTENGKISTEQIKYYLHGFGDQHHAQPKVISIAQSTEYGTTYTFNEIKKIADIAHNNNMFLHMDGARFANATAFLEIDPKKITVDAGVDVLSFGGTKNGMMYGEAVIFFNPEHSKYFPFIRKQGMQLASKMRFISGQFEELLSNDLWLVNARHSNKMARLLAEKVKGIPGIRITQKVQANSVFAIIPKECIKDLQEKIFFYVWDEKIFEVRWMCSFDTTEEDVINFAEQIKISIQKI